MNDPHVAALIYKIEHGQSVDYRKAQPMDHEETDFSVKVADQQVRFEFKKHYAAEDVARRAIEGCIRAWEFGAGLKNGPDYFKLKFDYAQIEDRKPTPGVVMVHARPARFEVTVGKATCVVSPGCYPPPQSVMLITPDVQTMYDRYMGYRQGREPLTTMAYFCLTILERSTKKNQRSGRRRSRRAWTPRKVAAKKYGIKVEVLKKIGCLSSKKGGQQARKASGTNNNLTAQDRRFLEEAIKAIIRRAAEEAHAPNSDFPEITLSAFPPV